MGSITKPTDFGPHSPRRAVDVLPPEFLKEKELEPLLQKAPDSVRAFHKEILEHLKTPNLYDPFCMLLQVSQEEYSFLTQAIALSLFVDQEDIQIMQQRLRWVMVNAMHALVCEQSPEQQTLCEHILKILAKGAFPEEKKAPAKKPDPDSTQEHEPFIEVDQDPVSFAKSELLNLFLGLSPRERSVFQGILVQIQYNPSLRCFEHIIQGTLEQLQCIQNSLREISLPAAGATDFAYVEGNQGQLQNALLQNLQKGGFYHVGDFSWLDKTLKKLLKSPDSEKDQEFLFIFIKKHILPFFKQTMRSAAIEGKQDYLRHLNYPFSEILKDSDWEPIHPEVRHLHKCITALLAEMRDKELAIALKQQILNPNIIKKFLLFKEKIPELAKRFQEMPEHIQERVTKALLESRKLALRQGLTDCRAAGEKIRCIDAFLKSVNKQKQSLPTRETFVRDAKGFVAALWKSPPLRTIFHEYVRIPDFDGYSLEAWCELEKTIDSCHREENCFAETNYNIIFFLRTLHFALKKDNSFGACLQSDGKHFSNPFIRVTDAKAKSVAFYPSEVDPNEPSHVSVLKAFLQECQDQKIQEVSITIRCGMHYTVLHLQVPQNRYLYCDPLHESTGAFIAMPAPYQERLLGCAQEVFGCSFQPVEEQIPILQCFDDKQTEYFNPEAGCLSSHSNECGPLSMCIRVFLYFRQPDEALSKDAIARVSGLEIHSDAFNHENLSLMRIAIDSIEHDIKSQFLQGCCHQLQENRDPGMLALLTANAVEVSFYRLQNLDSATEQEQFLRDYPRGLFGCSLIGRALNIAVSADLLGQPHKEEPVQADVYLRLREQLPGEARQKCHKHYVKTSLEIATYLIREGFRSLDKRRMFFDASDYILINMLFHPQNGLHALFADGDPTTTLLAEMGMLLLRFRLDRADGACIRDVISSRIVNLFSKLPHLPDLNQSQYTLFEECVHPAINMFLSRHTLEQRESLVPKPGCEVFVPAIAAIFEYKDKSVKQIEVPFPDCEKIKDIPPGILVTFLWSKISSFSEQMSILGITSDSLAFVLQQIMQHKKIHIRVNQPLCFVDPAIKRFKYALETAIKSLLPTQ